MKVVETVMVVHAMIRIPSEITSEVLFPPGARIPARRCVLAVSPLSELPQLKKIIFPKVLFPSWGCAYLMIDQCRGKKA